MSYRILTGDCRRRLRDLGENSVDAIVCDPPYGLAFMGKKWDYEVPSVEDWQLALHVLKPGGHLLAFASTRTQHRMAVNIEDAGFEIRDMLGWLHGQGYPKGRKGDWGATGLKPAIEPITLARKPLRGSIMQNYAAWGTGGLNIEACRIEGEKAGGSYSPPFQFGGQNSRPFHEKSRERRYSESPEDFHMKPGVRGGAQEGRWPANLLHDGSAEVIALFPEEAGACAPDRGTEASVASQGQITGLRGRVPGAFHADSGSAARFFWSPKISRADRNEGLGGSDEPAVSMNATMRDREIADWEARNGNHHTTVKPTELMRYLVRLVTPPGGIVLDQYLGSGSTGKAAMLEGFRFYGIEREEEYVAIAEARIAHAQRQRAEELAQPHQHNLFGSAA